MPISFSHLSFSWPDATHCLRDVSGVFNARVTGITGENGSGKSTLIKILIGELEPSSGTVIRPDRVGYLPQDLGIAAERSIADVFGATAILHAIESIEAGDPRPEHLDMVGNRWDEAEHLRKHLHEAGLSSLAADESALSRRLDSLSGGEAVRVALAAVLAENPEVIVLDEPTNNLDGDAKESFYHFLENTKNQVIVVSHDRAVLRRVEETAELYQGKLRFFEGNLDYYEAAVRSEQDSAARALRDAKSVVRRELKEQQSMETRLARDARRGAKFSREKRKPPIAMGNDKNRSEHSSAKRRQECKGKVAAAQAVADSAAARIRDIEGVYIELPETFVANGTRIAEFEAVGRREIVAGPERVRIAGPNGCGKTTLMNAIFASSPRAGYVRQRIDLPNEATVMAVVGGTPQRTRDQLARLCFQNDKVFAKIGTLSGGERFRVELARAILREPAPTLLLLDEPTNNLDMLTVEWLASALDAYRGAIIIVSHDEEFCARIGVTRTIELS